ncbi:hypothetical protein [Crateriforma spongiae]|uniref:hypothetical protein n=1 Tax=Crateriforma spongiae TaxID=2724528 RepID=UPI0039AF126B
MRRAALKFALLALAISSAGFIASTLLRGYRLAALRANTIASLSWGGGSPDDQILLDRLRTYIGKASRTDLLSPHIASVTYYPDDDGLGIGVDWIGLHPTIDAIRLEFADGSHHDVVLTDQDRRSHHRSASETLFFETWFSDLEVPEEYRPHLTDGLIAVELISEGKACSKKCMPPTYVSKEYHGSVAVEFVDGAIQYDLSTGNGGEPPREPENAS